MRRIDLKVPGGKLLRIDAKIDNRKIVSISIHGDFFVHPENGIERIERALRGAKIEDAEEILDNCSRNLQMIGISSKDILAVLDKFIR